MERKNDMRRPCAAGFRGRSVLAFSIVILGTLILSACTSIPIPTTVPISQEASGQCQTGHPAGFLSTSHGELVDATGCVAHLTGVNWFGFETSTFVPHGLGVRNWQDMLNQIARTGFNTIRLPFTNQLFDPASKPQGSNYRLNRDRKGLSGVALRDRFMHGAGVRALNGSLDGHDPTAAARPGLA